LFIILFVSFSVFLESSHKPCQLRKGSQRFALLNHWTNAKVSKPFVSHLSFLQTICTFVFDL